MKNIIYIFVALLATTFVGITPAIGQKSGPVTDTVTMGPGYGNEIYYSMMAGAQGTVDRTQWDIAFRASRMSASILTNDGAGVELYTYPKADTNGWATVDTAGLFSWINMVNSTTDWETGAFCRNQKGHPDYGWGKYNAVSHNVVGDSLFIIRLRDGSLRKLWIVEKFSSDNIFKIRFANIDGSGDATVMVDCNPYSTKNFVGYSIEAQQIVDFEPVVSTQWDLLFTKYMYTYPTGEIYPVTGVLSNYGIKVNKFTHVDPAFMGWDVATMDSSRSPIGFDWKVFNNSTFTYQIVDSLVYFIQDQSSNIHKLVFKYFAGSSTGKIAFKTELISAAGVDEVAKTELNAAVYPNPIKDMMNLVINPGAGRLAVVSLFDMTGHEILKKHYELPSETLSTLTIPVSSITPGLYMVRIQVGTNVISRKVVINN